MTHRSRLTAWISFGIFAGLVFTAPLPGQATPYVPLDDVAYVYIDALMARGELRSLASLERPYTVQDVRRALSSVAARPANSPLGSYAAGLERSLVKSTVEGETRRRRGRQQARQQARQPETFGARLSGAFYVYGQTSGRRELMLPDELNSVDPGITGRLVFAGGPVVGAVRVIGDTRLNDDPEFAGRKDRDIGGRTEDAYVSAQWRYGELFLGRASRNWGPAMMQGLTLGNYAYSYDHLYGRFGTPRVHFASIFAKLDSDPLGAGRQSNRYFAAHRLAGRLGGFEIGLTESFLMSGDGRSIDFAALNPLNIYALSWRNERVEANFMLGGDLAYRSRRLGNWSAEMLLDDFQVDDCPSGCDEPMSYGFTLAGEGIPLYGSQRLFASYTRVSSLAYRTPLFSERYTSFDVGLGRGFSDYDEVRAGIDFAIISWLPVKFYAAHRRQGEGDYRKAYPDTSQYRSTKGFLIGEKMIVDRFAFSGGGSFARGFELSADVGVSRIRQSGVRQNNTPVFPGLVEHTGFEGRIRIGWEPGWTLFRARTR